jgi:hypothetical protein
VTRVEQCFSGGPDSNMLPRTNFSASGCSCSGKNAPKARNKVLLLTSAFFAQFYLDLSTIQACF